MLPLWIAAMLQAGASASVPPPPIAPVVIWARQDGRTEEVHFVLLSPRVEPPMNAPDIFRVRLRINGRLAPVTLERVGAAVIVPSGGYLKATYRLALPADAVGDVLLMTDLSDEGGFLFSVKR